MKRYIIKTILILSPVLFLVMGMNYFVDPGHLFSDKFEKTVSTGLLQGNNVTNIYNYNERLLQKEIILKSTSCPEVVAMGSSRSMLVSSEFFPGSAFINSSVSGASVEDFIALYQLYCQKNCHLKKIFICIDPWILNKNNNQERWQYLAGEYNIFLRKCKLDTVAHYNYFNDYLQLISPSYFQASVTSLRTGADMPVFTKQKVNEKLTRLVDGSVCYDAPYRNATLEEVESKASLFANSSMYSIEDFDEISQPLLSLSELFFEELKKNGVEIEFFLCPYHPTVYKGIREKGKYRNVLETEKIFRNLAEKYHAKIVGSYDPVKAGVDASCFYDGMHCNEKGIRRIISPGVQ